uniref:Uncharacterized protein n=1 Tax=Rhizophora mucronata TaxID=61149 RepID=A0A2P2QDL6_RHIMU
MYHHPRFYSRGIISGS